MVLYSRMEPAVLQLAARVVQGNQEILLDQLGAIVDGRPVKQSHVLFVRLSDIIACFHQLLAAFQDSEPDRSHTDNRDYHTEGSLGPSVGLSRKVWLAGGGRSGSAAFRHSLFDFFMPVCLCEYV